MRENVMLVVRAYNNIVRDVNPEERRLFVDHIRKLDRRISQGMTKAILNFICSFFRNNSFCCS